MYQRNTKEASKHVINNCLNQKKVARKGSRTKGFGMVLQNYLRKATMLTVEAIENKI